VASLPESSAPLFDASRLPVWLEPADRHGLLSLFLQTADESLTKLKAMAEANPRDDHALGHELHALKGAAVSVGAMQLATLAKAMESDLKLQSGAQDTRLDKPEFQKALLALQSSLDATRSALSPFLIAS
jgi:HPt (histidine-containing phosphotransfer) domain-containing protein